MGDELRATPSSFQGSPAAAEPSGMVSTPTSPPPVVAPFEITTPASLTTFCRSRRQSVPVDGLTTIDKDSMQKVTRRQASRHLNNSEGAGPSVAIDVDAGDDSPAGLPETELHPAVIPKVRAQLQLVAGDLFTPQTVPIGPYYHGDGYSWLWAEGRKKKAVDDLRRQGIDISGLMLELAGVELTARGCYTHLPDDHAMVDSSEKFCSMLLHDGCYLVSLFANCYVGESPTSSNSNDGVPTIDNTVVRDTLYLLQNQIPMFVIDKILDYMRSDDEQRSAVMLIAEAVKKLLMQQLYIGDTTWVVPSTSSHLLDLLYSYLGSQHLQLEPASTTVETGSSRTGQWRRATEYRRYADLLFQPRPFSAGDEWTILAVRLDGGTLSIPLLCVDSNTWTLLRNLMALEELKEARPVTAYCLFMSRLASTAEDVEFLRGAKVIEHFLGSDESAAQGFAGLCHGVVMDINSLERNYLKPIWHRLEKRCAVRVHNFKGFFCDKYCSNVFHLFVFFVAVVLFACQLVQSIYAVIAYHKPNN